MNYELWLIVNLKANAYFKNFAILIRITVSSDFNISINLDHFNNSL